MYFLIDEIVIPSTSHKIFLSHIPKFRNLYLKVDGVTSINYFRTTLEAFEKPKTKKPFGSGSNNLVIRKNPVGSFLLMIVFKSKKYFEAYHDNTILSKKIHRKIAFYFGGKQLTIRAALHGEKIDEKD